MRTSVFLAVAAYVDTISAFPLIQRASPNITGLLGNPSASPNPVADKGFVGKLLTSDTTTDRFVALAEEVAKGKAGYKFDFNPAANPTVKTGEGGALFMANRKTFPVVTDLSITGAGLFYAPCALNTPHTHRATEFYTLVTDSTILAGFVLESGAFDMQINETLTQYQAMVFPEGSIQWQQNLDCKPAVAISVLNSDDPGVNRIAQNYLKNTDPNIVQASMGYPGQINADNFKELRSNIPTPFVKGLKSCFERCGIEY